MAFRESCVSYRIALTGGPVAFGEDFCGDILLDELFRFGGVNKKVACVMQTTLWGCD